LNPDDPSFDRGNCVSNRRQVGNVSVSAMTPAFTNAALRALASDWRVAGILNGRSGTWLTVTTTSDIAGTGIEGQRVNQVRDNPYGDKTLTNYLNRAAFTHPAPGSLGDHRNNSIEGPGFWTVDLAISRLVDVGGQQGLELRVEIFNLFNHFNWGDPETSFDSGNFGRIISNAGAPRIMQLGVKYGF